MGVSTRPTRGHGDAGGDEALLLLRMASRVSRMAAWWIELGHEPQVHWTNDAFETIGMGESRSMSLAQIVERICAPYRAAALAAFAACSTEGTPYDMQLEFVGFDEQTRWFRTIGEAVRDERGAIVRVQGAFQDITRVKIVERDLEDSIARFRQLSDAMPFIVWSATPEGAVDYSNRWFFEYTGLSEQTEPATRWQPCVHPEDLERAIPVWQRSVETHAPYSVEFRLRRASDGAYRWFRVNAEPVFDSAGRLLRWYGTGIDVDETKQLEQHATHSSRRLSTTLEAITDGFIAVDLQWKITYANARTERLLEVERDRLLGRNIWDALPESITAAIREDVERAREAEQSARFEARDAHNDRWFDLRVYPSEDGLAVFFFDDTDRRRSVEQLRDQATLLDHAQDAIFVQDSGRRITYWNHGAERVFGRSRAEALGQSVDALLGVDPLALLVATQEVMATGSWAGELEVHASTQRSKTVASRWSRMRTSGDRERILVINTDITQQKSVEAQLFRAQRLESIGTLAGGIAHDLNNVLTPILTSIDMLRDDERDPHKLSDLQTLETCARRGADMVRQLLMFARGTNADSRSELDLCEIAKDVLRIVRDTFPKDVRGTLHVSASAWRVRGDATQMHQLLMNLCVNARDAMPTGGTLTVTVEPVTIDEVYAGMNVEAKPGSYVALRVEDTGCGIAPELLERIFDPFFTTKEVGRGTGLGLSTCHAIVRAHAGFINVYSELGRGTRFEVYFPAVAAVESAASSADSPVDLPRGDGDLVLVVDDEELVRRITSRTLERYGYRVLCATNGAEAVASFAIHREEIALVLTDMSMPVMDGAAAIVALRSIDAKVKIIACSGLDANSPAHRAAIDGALDFLPKPYSAAALLRAVHRALS